MKKCSYCGAEAADDIKYCEQCGRPFDAQEPAGVRPVTVDMARERENALHDAENAAEVCEEACCTCAKAEPACAPSRETAPPAAAPEAAPVSAAPEEPTVDVPLWPMTWPAAKTQPEENFAPVTEPAEETVQVLEPETPAAAPQTESVAETEPVSAPPLPDARHIWRF